MALAGGLYCSKRLVFYENHNICSLIMIMGFVYEKDLIRTFHTSFLTTQQSLGFHSTRTQIQKVSLYSKTGFKRSF